tara:strand:- start:19841 stop:20779 length:939 start_codon:yes stop_codon:yes gene_type:complete
MTVGFDVFNYGYSFIPVVKKSETKVFNAQRVSNPCDAEFLIEDASTPAGCSGIGGKAGSQKTTCRRNGAKQKFRNGGGGGFISGGWEDADGNKVTEPSGIKWTTGGANAESGTGMSGGVNYEYKAPPAGITYKSGQEKIIAYSAQQGKTKWAYWKDYLDSGCLEQVNKPATENTGGISGRSADSDYVIIGFKKTVGTWKPTGGLVRWSKDKNTAALQLGEGKTYIYVDAKSCNTISVSGKVSEVIARALACKSAVDESGTTDIPVTCTTDDNCESDETCISGSCEPVEDEGNSKTLLIAGGAAVAAVIYFLI